MSKDHFVPQEYDYRIQALNASLHLEDKTYNFKVQGEDGTTAEDVTKRIVDRAEVFCQFLKTKPDVKSVGEKDD